MAKNFAKKNKVTINLGSLLLKVKNQRKLVNRSYFINNNGFIEKTYEIAFGDDAINRNFTITDVLDQLKELSDNYPDNHYE